ncbi:hypothetical protein [Streptomyces sp. NBC_00557]|jgi:hypothetical protein|uniref:hypothetical protein n=1 Tax=Streptomyces sp. NBC_00557 TaxID=2975776 RepID=UPI002E815F2D|nr:hypothetical protein [Streptomyces sp. NBC_00557]WUC36367.1 hypothetical protein OG956_20160 [Streptomyces sp. NBC_00557]
MTSVPAVTFRLHLPHQVLPGFLLPDGWAVAIDDLEYGLTSAAPSLPDLIRGYGGGRLEWPEHDPTYQGGLHT